MRTYRFRGNEDSGVIQMHDSVLDEQNLCIAILLEQAEMNLHDFLDRYAETLTVDDKEVIFRQMVSALCVVHTAGIIHFDLKPGNLLIFRLGPASTDKTGLIVPEELDDLLIVNGFRWKVKISDFGCSCRCQV